MKPIKVRAGSVKLPIYPVANRGRKLWEVRDHREGRGKTFRKVFSRLDTARAYANELAVAITNGTSAWLRLTPSEKHTAEQFIGECKKHGKQPDDVTHELKEKWRADSGRPQGKRSKAKGKNR